MVRESGSFISFRTVLSYMRGISCNVHKSYKITGYTRAIKVVVGRIVEQDCTETRSGYSRRRCSAVVVEAEER
ncbi:hypothetical protein M378DRAFT_440431 [Amanita muscaria Koide BX008]|uniref:Uncharacterized protein n=1 Tax=Amanita muscaria (strain Koide BX008) TaxID=946122 RepID=A0A0C2XAJ8_AMAMK|nr:hypothetical protein M378DRAFT_440431 [Amanita muscaria Koide BX008]